MLDIPKASTEAEGATPPLPETVRVLNGEIRIGDTVGFGVREGNQLGMRVGIVDSFEWRKQASWKQDLALRVRVRVTHSSTGGVNRITTGVSVQPEIQGVEVHHRIIRVCGAGHGE